MIYYYLCLIAADDCISVWRYPWGRSQYGMKNVNSTTQSVRAELHYITFTIIISLSGRRAVARCLPPPRWLQLSQLQQQNTTAIVTVCRAIIKHYNLQVFAESNSCSYFWLHTTTHINFLLSYFSAPFAQIWASEDIFWISRIQSWGLHTRILRGNAH